MKQLYTNKLALTKKLILVVTVIACISHIHAQTLVAYYPLNGNAKDSSGNHYDGAISGGVSFNADENGNDHKAADFNGVDGRIDVPDNAALRPVDFSISAWFYLDKSPSRYKNIVTKNLCNGTRESFALQITPSNHIEGTASDKQGSIGVDGPVPSLYTWHLATMTFNQTLDSVKFYFDGVLTSILKTSLNIEYDNSSLSIGDELENCATDYFFHGRIDEVRLYNGILTDKQVSDLYNSAPPKPAKLIAYYPLNGNSKDSSGHHYDGTISGGVSFNADKNGNDHNAADFNGVDGRIDVPDNAAFKLQSFTASAWFYPYATPLRYKIIVGKNLCDGVLESFAIYINQLGHLSGTVSNGTNSAYVEYYTTPSLYTWHLAVMTYDHDSLKLYLDDKLVSAVSTHIQITYDNNSFAIGYQLENCANDYFFHGRIDDVRLYNGALTNEQVSDLYNSSSVARINKNSVTSKQLFNVSVFPNPASLQLNIYINNASKESGDLKDALNINTTLINTGKATLQVIGIAGNVLISKEVDVFNKNLLQLNVSQLTPGAYFIKLISADEREASVIKFEKQ